MFVKTSEELISRICTSPNKEHRNLDLVSEITNSSRSIRVYQNPRNKLHNRGNFGTTFDRDDRSNATRETLYRSFAR